MKTLKYVVLALVTFFSVPAVSSAAPVMPTSYDAPNGYTGSFTYWDDSYSGSGSTTTSGAALSGGLGDLTDGIIASANWNGSPGLYVGWTINPIITFHFASLYDFQTVRIHFDDANGFGGVSAPAGVNINGTPFAIADPAGSAPFFADFDISGFAPTDSLTIQLLKRNTWVFASEFQFEATPVPIPSAILLLGSGLAGLVGIGSQRKKI